MCLRPHRERARRIPLTSDSRLFKTLSRPLVALTVIGLTVACGGGSTPTSATPPVPNLAGTWTGSWQRQQCSETGNTGGVACASTPGSGSVEIVLTQSGVSVQGSVTIIPQTVVPISGTVAADGSFAVSGQLTQNGGSVTTSIPRATVSGTSMNGTLTLGLNTPNLANGSLSMTAAMQGVTRR